MSYLTLRAAIRQNREEAGLSRERTIKRLEGMPGCPERLLDKDRIRRLETETSKTPDNLTEVRYLSAAVGLDWARALELLGGWPPVELRG